MTRMIRSAIRYAILFLLLIPGQVAAEDGSRLWLRFQPLEADETLPFTSIQGRETSIATREFQEAWTAMAGKPLPVTKRTDNGTLILGTLGERVLRPFSLDKELKSLDREGYLIQTLSHRGREVTVVAAAEEAGLLYGTYHLLRLIQTGEPLDRLNIRETPAYNLRLLNHWDNLNGTVERGYAGYSIWKWDELPDIISPRYKEYARANASIGINGTVLNNVNASPSILTPEYLEKVRIVANELRPYHIKVYLSINFSSPAELGGLKHSDPLDEEVQEWWNEKVKEIYRLIPDFGGFLVKANSEGLPGPQDYGRTHADGANMLADALKPYGGVVMWRAFVYNPTREDRAKQAYQEFKPLDGSFRDNVIVQVKNGPVDFQPREPFSPLFGAMEQTSLMPELQITQEYLGFSNHLVFLATQWKEFFESDTYCQGPGSTVAKTTDGSLFSALSPGSVTAIAGVANIGEDTNWCGHHFAQANWYAFGRLAWNHRLTADQIAEEWLRMTFTKEASFVAPVKEMMLQSWETTVNYMMPLGLHHIFAWNHHYGPEPWCDVPGARADWLPHYYHNANTTGIGFDRTTNGSDAVSQYYSPLNEQFNDVTRCPEELILWFHHVPWDHEMKSGRTLWDELCYRYDLGVQQVREFQKVWDRAEQFVDEARFKQVQSKLKIHARDAVWWKDACLLYFQTYSGMPIPYDIERPVHELDELKKIRLNLKHHN